MIFSTKLYFVDIRPGSLYQSLEEELKALADRYKGQLWTAGNKQSLEQEVKNISGNWDNKARAEGDYEQEFFFNNYKICVIFNDENYSVKIFPVRTGKRGQWVY